MGYPMFAQLPFVSFEPTQAQPPRTRPHTPPSNPMDPLGLGRSSSRTASRPSVQKEHFGLILGSSYNVSNIAWQFIDHYGDDADCGGTGDFYQIRVYDKRGSDGGVFGFSTIDFYKGRFWKICYSKIYSDPQEFADNLERKYSVYSVSDTRYEYQCGDIYIEFDGKELRYVSESVTRIVAY